MEFGRCFERKDSGIFGDRYDVADRACALSRPLQLFAGTILSHARYTEPANLFFATPYDENTMRIKREKTF